MRVYVCGVVIVLAVLMNCARTTEAECKENLIYTFYMLTPKGEDIDESTHESRNNIFAQSLIVFDECMKESKKKRVFSIELPR